MPPKQVSTVVSRSSVKKRLWLLAVLAVFCAAVAYPPPANMAIDFVNSTFGLKLGHLEKGFVLGLDLQGGCRSSLPVSATSTRRSS